MIRQLLLGIILIGSVASQALAYDLSRHQWRHRLLFLIAPGDVDRELAAQQHYLNQRRDTVLDRDLIVFQLFRNDGLVGETPLSAETVRTLRQQLGVTAKDRLVILIGKDGGIKRRADLNTDLKEIFRQIDSMPMRREEMRVKTKAGIPITPP